MTARQAPDMHSVLMDLVGQTIPTLTGKPNRIVNVDGDIVWVGTGRSPSGKPVAIAEIQAAADHLFAYGEVEIAVSVVGYRSAFIGAVLSRLPGAVAALRPRRVRLANFER